MRIAFVSLLLAAVVFSPAHARDEVVKFDGVQERCAHVGKIKFGANAKWSHCSVTKGRWVATLDFIDMYQAQYCFGNAPGECEQRALLLFGNRAYTPKANLMLQRVDSGDVQYDNPQLMHTAYGDILTLSAHLAGGGESKSYFRWKSGRWMPVDARGWLRDLAKQLPKGETINAGIWPELDSMSAQATLHSAGDSGVSDRIAAVELGIVKDRFVVKKVTLVQKAS